MKRERGGIIGLSVLAALAMLAAASPLICPGGPFARVATPLLAPGAGTFALWLGTDDLGRGVACQVAYGLQASYAVGLGTLALAVGIGVPIGLAAGYLGNPVDAMLVRVVAGFQVVPRFFLAVFASALFGPSLVLLMLVLGLTAWPLIARLVRTETQSLSRRPFVMAAEALGCSAAAVLWRHILPNALPPVRAAIPVVVGGAILAEAALGFIGLGDARMISLGRLIAEAYPFFMLAPWMSIVPACALIALVLGIHGVSR